MRIGFRILAFGLVVSATLAATACDDDADARRAQFVRDFVTSVYEDTDLYKTFVPYMLSNTGSDLNRYRLMMTKDFKIVRYDKFGILNSYEYYIGFSNGLYGLVYVSDKNSDFIAEGFHVYSREWGGSQDKKSGIP